MIKEQIIEYRNTHKESRVLLGTVLGELDRISKTPTDVECVNRIKKMIEDNILCNLVEENEILNKFIPKQLCESTISELISEGNFANLGECMKYFKQHYNGCYDGTLVSKTFKANQ